jgi:hypothetical protein
MYHTETQVALLTACEAALDWFDEMTEACEPGCDCTHDKLRAAVRAAERDSQ